MKKIIILLAITGCSNFLIAQNAPVVEKSAPQSNNTLNNDPALNSNSGVNPMGNPGTITSSTSNSAASNQTLEAHPNIEPGTFLTSSPGGTVVTTVNTNGPVTQKTATAANNSGGTTVVSTVNTGTVVSTVKTSPVPEPQAVATPVTRDTRASSSTAPAKTTQLPAAKSTLIPGYSPVLGNYVPTETITRIKTKFGSNVYDIRTVKVSGTDKIGYIVRLAENGQFRDELYYDAP